MEKPDAESPILMHLPCPKCGELHIVVYFGFEFSDITHACQRCSHVWRPAVEPTIGVRFLPGFKNENEDVDWSSVLPYNLRVKCAICESDTNAPAVAKYTFRAGYWYCGKHS